jgi:hypothetical protein
MVSSFNAQAIRSRGGFGMTMTIGVELCPPISVHGRQPPQGVIFRGGLRRQGWLLLKRLSRPRG